ncbi:MAG: AEC family transporter [Ruminococcus sp.]|nr:AEC family transporter [Ruminococcus sp.]
MAGIITNQTIIMLLLIFVGIFAYKSKIISKDGGKQLSAFVLEIVNPVIVIHAYMGVKYETHLVVNLLWTFALAVITYIVSIVAVSILVRKKEGREYAIERFSAVYSNCGFMGIPLANALYGLEGVFYVTAYLTIFFIFAWTHGIIQLTGERDIKAVMKALRSPTIVGVVVGLVLFFSRISLPSILSETLGHIAALNTPLAMVASGVSVAQVNFLNALKNKRVYIISAMKLLIVPLVSMAVLLCFPFVSDEVRMVVLVLISAPAAAMCTLQCQSHGLNDIYASQLFAMTTIFSIATMPLIVKIFSAFI